MSVSANLFIDSRVTPSSVAIGLKTMGAKEISLKKTEHESHVIIQFSYKNEKREINFFFDSPELPLSNNMLQLNVRGNYSDILKGLGNIFSGIYQGNDDHNSYQVIYGDDNLFNKTGLNY